MDGEGSEEDSRLAVISTEHSSEGSRSPSFPGEAASTSVNHHLLLFPSVMLLPFKNHSPSAPYTASPLMTTPSTSISSSPDSFLLDVSLVLLFPGDFGSVEKASFFSLSSGNTDLG